MVLTRLNHQQIFHREVQRLFRIELELFDPLTPHINPIVYRPLFVSAMEEQFMNNVAKEQIKTLTKFGGSANEDVLKWLQDIEEVFDRAQLQPSNKYLAVQSYLTNAAAKWFRFNKSSIDEWSTFKVAIIKAYQPSLHETLLKMEQRHQLPGEAVMEYYYDKMHLCLQADPNMSVSMMIHYLTKGLNDILIPHVIRRHPTSANDFLLIAQDEEKIQSTLNGLAPGGLIDNYPNDDIPGDQMVTLVKRPVDTHTQSRSWTHKSSVQPLMDLPSAPIQSSASPYHYYHQRPYSSSTSRPYSSPTPRSYSTFTSRPHLSPTSPQCYQCHRFGHIAKYCPDRKNF